MVMKLPLWHCPTAIHLSTACQPAYVCNCLPPNNHHCLSTHPPPSLVPSRRFRYPHTLHTHKFPPSSACLCFSLSSRPSLQVWAFKTGAVINLWASTVTSDQTTYTHPTKHTHTHTHTHRRIIPLFLFLSSFLSFFLSSPLSLPISLSSHLSLSLSFSLFRLLRPLPPLVHLPKFVPLNKPSPMTLC